MSQKLKIATLAVLLLLPALNAEQITVRGEITAETPVLLNTLTVELEQRASPAPVSQAPVAANGSFVLHNLPAGDYELRVADLYGRVLHREFVSTSQIHTVLIVRLPAQ